MVLRLQLIEKLDAEFAHMLGVRLVVFEAAREAARSQQELAGGRVIAMRLFAGDRHGKPGREVRPQSVTVDIHAHVGVPEAAKFVEPHLDWATIPLAHFANAETKALNQKQEADIRATAGADRRLADLDAMGVDVQMIAPPPPQCYYTVPLDIAVKAAQLVNDGIAAFCTKRADRLKGFGTVPMPDGHEAAKELERCTKELGFKGVQVITNVAGKELSDPAFAPFWKKAEELGTLVMHRIPTASPTPRDCHGSISTTSSAIRWRPRLRCII